MPSNHYYHRDLEKPLKEALQQFPAVLVTGPRQAGKSTLLQHCLKDYRYVTLDDLDMRAAALKDPALFLEANPAPIVIDEIQYAPDLLSYIKMRIDKDRHRFGQYVLTGSQIFQLMQGVSESLAGRIAVLQLYPFSWLEIERIPGFAGSSKSDLQLISQLVQGFYPEFFHTVGLSWGGWFTSYVTTYLERDVRHIRAVSDLSQFKTFLTLLAARVGQLLNLSEIAKECAISQPTAKAWLSILESTYVIHLHRPYFRNRGKRLVKSPKVYFVDTGLLCFLLDIDSADRLMRAPERGSIFENMVVMEWVKRVTNQWKQARPYFYRTAAGVEVDLLFEKDRELYAYEIKMSKALNSKMASGVARFKVEYPEAHAGLLTLRDSPFSLTQDIQSTHWSEMVY